MTVAWGVSSRARRWCLLGLALALLASPGLHAGPLPDEITIGGIELVRIPAGMFHHIVDQNDPGDSSQGADLRIWLDDYYMARYEVRATDFARYLNDLAPERLATGYLELDARYHCGLRLDPDGRWQAVDPQTVVAGLTWSEAAAFAEALGFRLPTALEWEKAARGTDRRTWPWGDARPDDTRALFRAGDCQTYPVDRYRKGVSPYGLFGMAGGVREFVQDWENRAWDRQLTEGQRNPPLAAFGDLYDITGRPRKYARGGCWFNDATYGLSVNYRKRVGLDSRATCNGVRLALDAEAVRRHLQTAE